MREEQDLSPTDDKFRTTIKPVGAIHESPFRTVEDAGPYNHNIKSSTKSVGDDVLCVPSKTQRNFINDGRIISSPTNEF